MQSVQPEGHFMASENYGSILTGNETAVRRAYEKWSELPVDQEMLADSPPDNPHQTTLASSGSVTGPGTFFRRVQRTLIFEPTEERGWWFKREDIPDAMPILVSVNNVWTTVRNIVLCSGSPHNYMRMVEHIVALKVGMGLDNVMIRMTSGDPPLFDRGSMDLVETVESANIVTLPHAAGYVTVQTGASSPFSPRRETAANSSWIAPWISRPPSANREYDSW
jgi:hypothetical protein